MVVAPIAGYSTSLVSLARIKLLLVWMNLYKDRLNANIDIVKNDIMPFVCKLVNECILSIYDRIHYNECILSIYDRIHYHPSDAINYMKRKYSRYGYDKAWRSYKTTLRSIPQIFYMIRLLRVDDSMIIYSRVQMLGNFQQLYLQCIQINPNTVKFYRIVNVWINLYAS